MKFNFYIIFAVLLFIFIGFVIFKSSSIDFDNRNQASIVNNTEVAGDEVNSIEIEEELFVNPITGIYCENYTGRPLAVMMANDPVARPLSGIGRADLIIEMPVITGSITRMMAFFICDEPKEIGALRSARHDFIPLAMGFDSIFVHWGGSHFALDKLDRGIMDNINALFNPFGTFYRKSGLPRPHNGFTSYSRLWLAVKKLGYRQEMDFKSYIFENKDKCDVCENGRVIVDYAAPYDVYYDYDFKENVYFRFRNSYPELDRLDNSQVKVKNLVIMYAASRQIYNDYNDVDVEGNGKSIFYKNGEEIFGIWEKDKNNPESPLLFFDNNGKKIKFVPGKIIIEIVEPY